MTRLLLSLSLFLLLLGFTIPRMFDSGTEARILQQSRLEQVPEVDLDVVSDDLPEGTAPAGLSQADFATRVRANGDLFNRYIGGVTNIGKTLLEFPEGTDLTTAVVLCYGDFGTARASTYESLVEYLSKSSDAVVLGKVETKTSYFSQDKSFVYTEYVLKVRMIYKDDPRNFLRAKERIVVVGPGGSIRYKGRVGRVHIKNLQPYKSGETEYLLFLTYVPETGAYVALEPYSSFALHGETVRNTTVESQFGDLNIERTSLLGITEKATAGN